MRSFGLASQIGLPPTNPHQVISPASETPAAMPNQTPATPQPAPPQSVGVAAQPSANKQPEKDVSQKENKPQRPLRPEANNKRKLKYLLTVLTPRMFYQRFLHL